MEIGGTKRPPDSVYAESDNRKNQNIGRREDMVADEENEVEGNVVGNISLRYHGPALDRDHTMSARTLAPALLSFADAIDAAKDELAPKAKVELRVSATQPGSFDIQFIPHKSRKLRGIGSGPGAPLAERCARGRVRDNRHWRIQGLEIQA